MEGSRQSPGALRYQSQITDIGQWRAAAHGGGLVILAISDSFEGNACDEAGAGFTISPGCGIDAAQDALGEGDVQTLGFPREGGEIHGADRPDHVGIVGIGGVSFDRLWRRDFFPGIKESLNVKGKCFRGVGNGLVQGVSRAEAAGKVWNVDTVGLAGCVFDGDGVVHDL